MTAVCRRAGGSDGVSVASSVFLLLFTFCHLLGAAGRKDVKDRGYFSTLTVFTLLLTCLVVVAPSPPSLVAAALSINVLVVAVYYGLVNTSFVKGTSFLLHGGTALLLLFLVASRRLSAGGSPRVAALLAALLLCLNGGLQLAHERRSLALLYPSCADFRHPLWRLAFLPALGALAAAWIASASSG
ncbi:MAG: hypothetical protein EBV73_03485 [Rhodocyclales bacterium]|nr:hypothetical protein [Rhodocyclales bacterium]